MISEERFFQLKRGDFILTRTPKGKITLREVIKVSVHTRTVWLIKLVVNKYKGNETGYPYCEIKNKIVGVWRKTSF